MGKAISKEYNITPDGANRRLAVRSAKTKKGLVTDAELSARAYRGSMNINRRTFFVGVKPAIRKGGPQLTFQIKRNGPKETVQGAFFGYHGTRVLIRKGKGRGPIKGLSDVDVPQMFNDPKVKDPVKGTILKKFEANFNRAVHDVLRILGKR